MKEFVARYTMIKVSETLLLIRAPNSCMLKETGFVCSNDWKPRQLATSAGKRVFYIAHSESVKVEKSFHD